MYGPQKQRNKDITQRNDKESNKIQARKFGMLFEILQQIPNITLISK